MTISGIAIITIIILSLFVLMKFDMNSMALKLIVIKTLELL